MVKRALAALDIGDEAALEQFTREVIHLPPLATHFVMLALWETRKRLARMSEADNPIAYVRSVAQRLIADDGRLELGKQTVHDGRGRAIGHRTVDSLWREDGRAIEMSDDQMEEVVGLGFVPADSITPADVIESGPRLKAQQHYNSLFIDPRHLSEDERILQRAQCQGISRSEMADYLGWSGRKVNRIRQTLDRKRRKGLHTETSQVRDMHVVEGYDE